MTCPRCGRCGKLLERDIEHLEPWEMFDEVVEQCPDCKGTGKVKAKEGEDAPR